MNMANAKPILYGVSDFILMRTEGRTISSDCSLRGAFSIGIRGG